MKKTLLGSLFTICAVAASAQTLSPKVNPSAGGYATSNNGISLSFTIGETLTPTLTVGANTLTQGQQQPEIDLLSSTVAGELCEGGTLTLTFVAIGYVATGNIFTLQLSDASGDFSAPVSLGTLNGTASGSITGTVPIGTLTGPGYRVRVVGSQPNFTGSSLSVPACTCIAPSLACPPNVQVSALPNQCSSTANWVIPVPSGNCDPTLVGTASPNATVFLIGTTNVTYTASNTRDVQSQSCSFTVTVSDGQNPSIVCPSNTSKATDSGQCSAVVTYANPTFSDNCNDASLMRINGLASGSAFPLGLNVVNWKVTDVGGNTAVCSFSITVVDAQTPTITCPSSSTVNTTTGQCAAVVNYAVSGSDNCSGWSLSRTSGLQSGAQFLVGINTVVWKNTDTANNSTTCSFSVTVNETQLPSITCPANITANAATGLCTAVVNYTTPSVSDNCAGADATHVSGGASGSSFNKGLNTVQWKATDAANNTKTCTFTITVNDTQLPNISCPANMTANTAAGTCAATVTFGNATATDNCAPPPTVAQTGGSASGSSFAKGVHTITFRAADGVGLTRTCSFRITVNDNVPPAITCPSNIVKNTDNNACTAVTTYAVTATDNCAGVTTTKISGLASGSAFPRGSNAVTWKATDAAGNFTLCSFTVTVNDAQLPVPSCLANINTTTTPGQCNKVVTYTTPTFTDNCAGGSINLFSGLASGSVFPVGTSTVVWRAIDASSQTATCSFSVTVTDNELPVVSCPPNTTVAGSGSPCGYPASQLTPATATDNCGVTSLASNAPASLPSGATTVTWTATDPSSNVKTCSFAVTVTCGAAAKYEVGSMKYEDRDEVGSMKYEARTPRHPSSLILHNSSLTLFPNPSSGIFLLSFSGALAQGGQISIHDAQGRLVWQQKVTAQMRQLPVDLSSADLADGMYWVLLRTEARTICKKLVLSRL